MNETFAVIDTETNWRDDVMSIGIVISQFDEYNIIDEFYCILNPEYKKGGMFFDVLKFTRGTDIYVDSRRNAINAIIDILIKYNVKYIFAYNATFDFNHLPELARFIWVDIMRIAAYKQYNTKLPKTAEYCQSGRLKSGYGVEKIISYLTGKNYKEVHNAICDAEDELVIMKMLNKTKEDYYIGVINSNELADEIKFQEYVENMNPKKNKNLSVKDFSKGDIVEHINFGEGEIIDMHFIKYVQINFKTITKFIDLEYAIENGYIKKK